MDFNTTIDEVVSSLRESHHNKSGKYPGRLLTVFYSSVAVLAFGLIRLSSFVKRQITADTASPEMIVLHAKTRGLTLVDGESPDELLQRYLDDIQNPRSGGNRRDWERWSAECSYYHDDVPGSEWTETVLIARAFENARGPGTINIAVVSNRSDSGYEGIATTSLLSALTSYLDSRRPLGIWDFSCYNVDHETVDVDIDISSDSFSTVSTAVLNQLNAYLQSLLPGEPLTLLAIFGIAQQCGASNAVINSPAADVYPSDGPSSYSRVWPGTIQIGQLS